MPVSRTSEPAALISPVIDCEPPPVGVAACRPAAPNALRRRTPRPLRQASVAAAAPEPPPRGAVVFADAALRRVLEVIDRRRPIAQLRSVLAPALTEPVLALARHPHAAAATLRRIRLRMVEDAHAAEVFGTYTRGPRVRAIAARIALDGERWRIVALQIG